MEDVVAELRERLEHRRVKPSVDVREDRLRSACLNGAGHLMVTGSNRTEIHRVLSRVLDAVGPLSAIRTLAVDPDPNATVDRVISSFGPRATPDNYLDRKAALVELLARAEQARKSIFVVVDDADRATIDELERLRASLEVAPEAIEPLRLVLIGDTSLPERLSDPAARALRTRIATTVSMDEASDSDVRPKPQRKTAASYASAFAVAATVVFCAAAYTMYLVGFVTGGDKVTGAVRPPRTEAAPPSRASMYAIRGDEAFLTSPLRIDAVAVPRKRINAPPPARVVRPAGPAQATKPPVPTAGTKAVKATAAKVPPKAAGPEKSYVAAPSPGSSIDAFMKRFPAGH